MEIRIEFEDVSTVKKRMKVEVPAEIAQQEFDQVAGEYKKHARLPGFRPGKAPVQLVKRHFAKKIRTDVLQKLIPESYDHAIREKGMQPLGEPALENLTFEEGEELVYEANFEIHPEIELVDYKGLKVETTLEPVTEGDVDSRLEEIREQNARLVSVEDRSVEEGDYVGIDLQGQYLEEESSSSSSLEPFHEENVVVQVGDESTHESFNMALLGMNLAEEKQFEVDYTEDYPEEKLAGHRILFTAQVEEIKKKELPELNNELVKDLGECESLEELRVKIHEQLGEERERNRESDLKNKLLDQLIEKTSFEVPEILVEDQMDRMIQDLARQMASGGVDPGRANVDWVKMRAGLRSDAEKRVRANMILSKLGLMEKIEVSAQELEAELQSFSESMGQAKEKVKQYFEQHNRMEGLKTQLVRQKALEGLLESAKVVEG